MRAGLHACVRECVRVRARMHACVSVHSLVQVSVYVCNCVCWMCGTQMEMKIGDKDDEDEDK